MNQAVTRAVSCRCSHGRRGLKHSLIGWVGVVMLAAGGCRVGGPGGWGGEDPNDLLRRENLELKRTIGQLEQDRSLLQAQVQTLQQRLDSRSSVEGVEPADLLAVAVLAFDKHTGALDTDGDGVDDTVRVYAQTLNQHGQFMPAAGQAMVQLVSIAPNQPPVQWVQREYDPASFAKAYRSGLTGTHYTLEVKLPEDLLESPPTTDATVKVTFTDAATGVVLTGQQAITVNAQRR